MDHAVFVLLHVIFKDIIFPPQICPSRNAIRRLSEPIVATREKSNPLYALWRHSRATVTLREHIIQCTPVIPTTATVPTIPMRVIVLQWILNPTAIITLEFEQGRRVKYSPIKIHHSSALGKFNLLLAVHRLIALTVLRQLVISIMWNTNSELQSRRTLCALYHTSFDMFCILGHPKTRTE